MRVAGRMVADVLALLKDMVKPGVTTGQLNDAAAAKMKEMGGKPSFLGYHDYPAVVCISIDEEVVHGIPGGCNYRKAVTPDRRLEDGQVISLDCGVILPDEPGAPFASSARGWHGDSAVTLPVGEISPEKKRLLEVCRECLWAGIRAVKPGVKLSQIAGTIESFVRAQGNYGIVENYVGHGIGRALHEAPQVPNYVSDKMEDWELRKGYVIAIEPMVNLGTKATRVLQDGWTVVTKDGKPSAHFEHTVAVTETGFEVLTLRADGGSTH
ncbi:type I methionyl aminopeptidase [bacterium]|nr:type I methionyl aminopeptidase [bacterium]